MKNNIINLAKRLIEVESIEGNQKALEDVLEVANKAVEVGTKVDFLSNIKKSALFHNQKVLPEKFDLILNGHIDVVPAKKEQYLPYIEGDKLIGRGAVDMKSAVAVLICVFNEMATKTNIKLGLQIVTDEETGGNDGTKYQIAQGITSKVVIAGENTNLDIANMAKGICWMEIEIGGKTGHAAYPWDADNALMNANRFMSEVSNLYPSPAKEAWVTTVNFANMSTNNQTFNKIPDSVTLSLDFRYVPGDPIFDTNEKDVIEYFSKMKNVKRVNLIELEPSHYLDQDSMAITLLKKSIEEKSSHKPVLIQKNGASDIRHFSKDTQGMVFGPIGAGLHTDDEWASIASLDDFYDILVDFIGKLEKDLL